MNFDDWHNETDSLCPRRSFEAGQQSQQAKIDELQGQIDQVLDTVSNMSLSQYENDFDKGYDQAVSDLFINLKSILKGNKDEN